ncbi:hypothetical protein CEXT_686561 [Caerostris extrusa]|uniref:Uncharacterized protein n=1 Tax=Caerostris extrusa TaxID=172846 RepID=A0AAV4VBJ4_CAEEX|nr:hypothetical protein CEXT_686561 [Caerostris extrusa]
MMNKGYFTDIPSLNSLDILNESPVLQNFLWLSIKHHSSKFFHIYPPSPIVLPSPEFPYAVHQDSLILKQNFYIMSTRPIVIQNFFMLSIRPSLFGISPMLATISP